MGRREAVIGDEEEDQENKEEGKREIKPRHVRDLRVTCSGFFFFFFFDNPSGFGLLG